MNYKLFTSESVCSGHPDKICDQISDAILDECIRQDKFSRTGVETLATANKVVIAGEIGSKAKVNFEKVARQVIRELGYVDEIYDFDYKNANIEVLLHKQSEDIALGVLDNGAGDQGMMFGFASDETPELMPTPIVLANQIVQAIDRARKKELPYLRPDGKSQVTIEYKDGGPHKVTKVITAVPYNPKISAKKVSLDIFEHVVRPVLKKYGYSVDKKDYVNNGTGKWEIGGPASDTGLTGRKLMVDTYGSLARIGGGCLSGKDPTKVDRSAAYAARYIAKSIVAKKLAKKCEVQLAYAIGKPRPVARSIDTFRTEKVSIREIEDFAWTLLDLSVKGMIDGLNLRRPIFKKTAAYGHFGRSSFPWEQIKE